MSCKKIANISVAVIIFILPYLLFPFVKVNKFQLHIKDVVLVIKNLHSNKSDIKDIKRVILTLRTVAGLNKTIIKVSQSCLVKITNSFDLIFCLLLFLIFLNSTMHRNPLFYNKLKSITLCPDPPPPRRFLTFF